MAVMTLSAVTLLDQDGTTTLGEETVGLLWGWKFGGPESSPDHGRQNTEKTVRDQQIKTQNGGCLPTGGP